MATVVITGVSGFIGRHLVQRLLRDGHVVIAASRRIVPVQCDIIYHLACPSSTQAISNDPSGIMDIIFDATRNALEIDPYATFVNASSKGAEHILFDNSPQTCYNVMKRTVEMYLEYARPGAINYRLPSVYGEGMHESGFIKRCVDGIATPPSDPNKMHYIAHVEDVVEALATLTPIAVEEITLGEIYDSFGSGRRRLHRTTPNSPFAT